MPLTEAPGYALQRTATALTQTWLGTVVATDSTNCRGFCSAYAPRLELMGLLGDDG